MNNIIIINNEIITETKIKDLSDLFSDTEKFLSEINKIKELRAVDNVVACMGEYIITYERSSFRRWLCPEHATIIRNEAHQIIQFGADDYESDLYLTEFCIENNFEYMRYNKYTIEKLLSRAVLNIYKKYFADKMTFDEFFHTGSYGPIWFRFMYTDQNTNHNFNDFSEKIYLKDCENFALWDEEEEE